MEINSPSSFIGLNGGDYISFGSGQPDLPPPESIFRAFDNYKEFKYGLIQGQDNLREKLTDTLRDSKKDNFVITNGASEALDLALRVVGKNNGKIMMHKPYYYSYLPLAKLNKLEPVFVETEKGKIVQEDFDEKIHDCKAIMINSPCNPTGRIQDIKTLKHIEKVCADLKITIISDEVYKDLNYMRENYDLSGDTVVTINSFSKTFSMCGFRVGYLYCNNQDFLKNVIEIKTHSSMNTSIIAQQMAFEALKIDRKYVEDQLKVWRERRNLIYEGLNDLGLETWKPEGAFYVLPKVKNPSKMVEDLFFKHNVITYKGEWFGAEGRIRLSYALDKEKIEKGLKIIGKYLEN